MELTRIGRVVLSWLLSLGVASLLLLPQEHRHSATPEADDHQSGVTHRHVAPHHLSSEQAQHVDHDEGDPQWLDSSFVAPRSTPVAAPVDHLLGQEVPIASANNETRGKAGASIVPSVHDPPRTAHGLRAPPLLAL